MRRVRLTRKNSYRKISAQQRTRCAVKCEIYFRAANSFQLTCVRLLLVKLIIENRLNKLTAVKVCRYYSQFNQHREVVVLYAVVRLSI